MRHGAAARQVAAKFRMTAEEGQLIGIAGARQGGHRGAMESANGGQPPPAPGALPNPGRILKHAPEGGHERVAARRIELGKFGARLRHPIGLHGWRLDLAQVLPEREPLACFTSSLGRARRHCP